MRTIYAVIWNDFIPLSLICENEKTAIETAKNITERANHIEFIKAIKLTDNDELVTLWEKSK